MDFWTSAISEVHGQHQLAHEQARRKNNKTQGLIDPSARQYLYAEIPIHYAWKTTKDDLDENQPDDDDEEDDDDEDDNADY